MSVAATLAPSTTGVGLLMGMVHFSRSAWVVICAAFRRVPNLFLLGTVSVVLAACGGANEVAAPTATNDTAAPTSNNDLLIAAAAPSTTPERLFPTPNATPAQCKASQQYWERLFAHPERLITYMTHRYNMPPDPPIGLQTLEFQKIMPNMASDLIGNTFFNLTTSYGGWGYTNPCGPNGPEVYIDVAFTMCEAVESLWYSPGIGSQCLVAYAMRWRMDPLDTFDPQYPWWNMRKQPATYPANLEFEKYVLLDSLRFVPETLDMFEEGRFLQRLAYAGKALTFDPSNPVWAPYFFYFGANLWRPLPSKIRNFGPGCDSPGCRR